MNLVFSKSAHLEKSVHNQQFSTDLGQFADQYRDWQVTANFYAAVHVLQAYFREKTGYYPQNHKERDGLVLKLDELSTIYSHYRELKFLSVSARYLCQNTNTHDVGESQRSLQEIRDHVTKLL